MRAGYSQKDVATILGFKSVNRISEWENGKRLPGLSNAIRLSILYRIMVDALFIDQVRLMREEIFQAERDHLRKIGRNVE